MDAIDDSKYEAITLTLERDNPLIKLFNDRKIMIFGTSIEPLFSVKSIRTYLGCKANNYRETKLNKIPDRYIKIGMGKYINGQINKMLFLTEEGMYLFISMYDTEVAREFNIWVVETITQIRRTIIKDLRRAVEKGKFVHKLDRVINWKHYVGTDDIGACEIYEIGISTYIKSCIETNKPFIPRDKITEDDSYIIMQDATETFYDGDIDDFCIRTYEYLTKKAKQVEYKLILDNDKYECRA